MVALGSISCTQVHPCLEEQIELDCLQVFQVTTTLHVSFQVLDPQVIHTPEVVVGLWTNLPSLKDCDSTSDVYADVDADVDIDVDADSPSKYAWHNVGCTLRSQETLHVLAHASSSGYCATVEQVYSTWVIPVQPGVFEYTVRYAWKPCLNWSPFTHKQYPRDFQAMVQALLLCHGRRSTRLSFLSKDTLLMIATTYLAPRLDLLEYRWHWAGAYQANAKLHIRLPLRPCMPIKCLLSFMNQFNKRFQSIIQCPGPNPSLVPIFSIYTSCLLVSLWEKYLRSQDHAIPEHECIAKVEAYQRHLLGMPWLRKSKNCVRLVELITGSRHFVENAMAHSSDTVLSSVSSPMVESFDVSADSKYFMNEVVEWVLMILKQSLTGSYLDKKNPIVIAAWIEWFICFVEEMPSHAIGGKKVFDLIRYMIEPPNQFVRILSYQVLQKLCTKKDEGGWWLYRMTVEGLTSAFEQEHSSISLNISDENPEETSMNGFQNRLEVLLQFSLDVLCLRRESMEKSPVKHEEKQPSAYLIRSIVRLLYIMNENRIEELELVTNMLLNLAARDFDLSMSILRALLRPSWSRLGTIKQKSLLHTIVRLMLDQEIISKSQGGDSTYPSFPRDAVMLAIVSKIVFCLKSPSACIARQALQCYTEIHPLLLQGCTHVDLLPVSEALWFNAKNHWDDAVRATSLNLARAWFSPDAPPCELELEFDFESESELESEFEFEIESESNALDKPFLSMDPRSPCSTHYVPLLPSSSSSSSSMKV